MKIVPRRTMALIGGDGKILAVGAEKLLPKAKVCEYVCEVEVRGLPDVPREMRRAAHRAVMQEVRLRRIWAADARHNKKAVSYEDETWQACEARFQKEEKYLRTIAEEILR